jgi:hypothetical protein
MAGFDEGVAEVTQQRGSWGGKRANRGPAKRMTGEQRLADLQSILNRGRALVQREGEGGLPWLGLIGVRRDGLVTARRHGKRDLDEGTGPQSFRICVPDPFTAMAKRIFLAVIAGLGYKGK